MPRCNEPMRLTAAHVALCERAEADHGRDPRFRVLTDEDFALLAQRLVDESGSSPLWIFAYGSLIWNRTFTDVEARRATAIGWHRSFCIEMRHLRGTPAQPGLMMALDNGGRCDGMAYRIADAERHSTIHSLLRREMGYHEAVAFIRWIPLAMDGTQARALVFYAGPRGPNIRRKLPLQVVAHQLARACGSRGSSAAYLFNTVQGLEGLGIRDRNLWNLQRLVADEIESINRMPLLAAE